MKCGKSKLKLMENNKEEMRARTQLSGAGELGGRGYLHKPQLYAVVKVPHPLPPYKW